MKEYIFFGVMGFLCVVLGVFGTLGYQEMKNERIYNGLYISQADNVQTATNIAKKWESKGDWVCINVAYDMPPSLAFETCVHECGHRAYTEIFAKQCEKDFTKCLGWLE
jgi:hypothetical protein